MLANLRQAGQYQMEEFARAGGVPVLLHHLRPLLQLETLTVTGGTLGENLSGISPSPVYHDIIRPISRPLHSDGGIAVLWGNLAPGGAVIKPKAARPDLLHHTGPALVFRSVADLEARIDDPDLPVTPDHVLVLQNAGPVGGAGMPEAGMLPIPKKLLAQGVRDMVRISDARMSGTAFGTVVLHAAPEAAVGGPIGLVRDGDLIELNVAERRLRLHVPEAELESRRAAWQPPPAPFARGYGRLFCDRILQADRGCDFDFLVGGR